MMLLPIYFIQTDFREGAFCMEEKQVEVIKKVDGPVIRDRKKKSGSICPCQYEWRGADTEL